MPIYKGGVKVFSIFKGGVPVTQVYKGATLVFPEAAPTATITSTPPAGYAGTVITFTAVATGAGTLTYSWQQLLPGGAWEVIPGAPNSPTYARTTVAGDNGAQVRVRIRDQYGTLGPASNVIAITVYAALGVTIAPASVNQVEGTVATWTATPSGGSGAYTYQWFLGPSNTPISGAVAATYQRTLALSDNGQYIFCQVASAGQGVNSNTSPMTVASAQPGLPPLPAGSTAIYYNAQPANLTDITGARPAAVGQRIRTIHEVNGDTLKDMSLRVGVPDGNGFILRQQADGKYYLEGSNTAAGGFEVAAIYVTNSGWNVANTLNYGVWMVSSIDSVAGNLNNHGFFRTTVQTGGSSIVPYSNNPSFFYFDLVTNTNVLNGYVSTTIDPNRPCVWTTGMYGNNVIAPAYGELNGVNVGYPANSLSKGFTGVSGGIGWMSSNRRWYEMGYYYAPNANTATSAFITAVGADRLAVYDSL